MPTVMGESEASRRGENGAQLQDNRWIVNTKFWREYIVWSDGCADTAIEILSTVGVPALFSTLAGVPCVKRTATEKESFILNGVERQVWHAKCFYDSSRDVSQADTPPEARTPEIRWYGENVTSRLWYDALDDTIPIQTSGKQAIPQKVNVYQPILEIKRFEPWPFNPNVALLNSNAINSSPFYGAPIKTCQMLPIESQLVVIENEQYSNTTYKIRFSLMHDGAFNLLPDTMLGRPIDYGTHIIPAGKVDPIEHKVDGEIVEVYLDGSGAPLADGLPPVFLEFNLYPLQDFNNLNLGPFF